MPKMQEQFSGMSMDGLNAENAGAIFRHVHGWAEC
jgi:hypothetical protein